MIDLYDLQRADAEDLITVQGKGHKRHLALNGRVFVQHLGDWHERGVGPLPIGHQLRLDAVARRLGVSHPLGMIDE